MILKKIINNHLLQHSLFWGLSYFILLRLYAYQDELYASHYIFAFLFHISLVFVVYLNLRIAIPYFLEQKRYGLFFVLFILLFLLAILLNEFTFTNFSDWLFPDYYFISYYTYFEIAQFIGSYLAISILLKFSKAWFRLKEQEQQISLLQKEKSEAELLNLKAQIQPHFLFNNLNSLYALAEEQDPRTPEIILNLADNMRYLLYDADISEVPLEKELDFIKNYLRLQALRLNDPTAIQFQLEGAPNNRSIAPLLLLPFLENAFKHGKITIKMPLRIQLRIHQGELSFSISNNIRTKDPHLPEKIGGIGLKNIQQRLAILYPNKHEINFKQGANLFHVDLKIKL